MKLADEPDAATIIDGEAPSTRGRDRTCCRSSHGKHIETPLKHRCSHCAVRPPRRALGKLSDAAITGLPQIFPAAPALRSSLPIERRSTKLRWPRPKGQGLADGEDPRNTVDLSQCIARRACGDSKEKATSPAAYAKHQGFTVCPNRGSLHPASAGISRGTIMRVVRKATEGHEPRHTLLNVDGTRPFPAGGYRAARI